MPTGRFSDDYNHDSLALVRAYGSDLELFVTPRYAPAYAAGYEVLSSALIRSLTRSAALFIDVGAHYGYYSLIAAQDNPDIRIVAVEPVPENLAVLSKNLEHHGIGPERSMTVLAAASEREGELEFLISEASDNSSFLPHPSSGTLKRMSVRTVPIGPYLRQAAGARAVIKIDTDGHEMEVLAGIDADLQLPSAVLFLVEANPKMLALAGRTFETLCTWFRKRSFSGYAIDEANGTIVSLDSEATRDSLLARHDTTYFNVLFLPTSMARSVMLFAHDSGLGGASRSLIDLATGLIRMGVLCNAVVPADGPLKHRLERAGCGTIVAPADMAPYWLMTNRDDAGDPPAASVSLLDPSIQVLRRKVAACRPDWILSQTIVSPWGAVFAETLGLRHALSAREYGVADHGLDFAYGFEATLKALYETSDSVFCITHDVRRTLFPRDLNRCTVIYSGFERDSVQKAALDTNHVRAAFTTDGPIACIPGAVRRSKGQADLIKAIGVLSRAGRVVNALIVGGTAEPDYLTELHSLVQHESVSGNVIFVEETPDVADYVRASDFVVSCSRHEALGRTFHEASLLGKPIVFPRTAGPSELLSDGEHGLAYEPGNHVELAAKIQDLLDDPQAAADRVRAAIALCEERLSIEALAARVGPSLRSTESGPARGHGRQPVLDLMRSRDLTTAESETWRPLLFGASRHHPELPPEIMLGTPIRNGAFATSPLRGSERGLTIVRFHPSMHYGAVLRIDRVEGVGLAGSPVGTAGATMSRSTGRDTETPVQPGRPIVFVASVPEVVLRFSEPVSHFTIVGELRLIPRDAQAEQLLIPTEAGTGMSVGHWRSWAMTGVARRVVRALRHRGWLRR